MDAKVFGSGSGSGSSLPIPVLVLAGVCTLVAVLVSAASIHLHLKNYRKPVLQRMVVRIMLMIPIYAVASLISLFSLEAAFVIDAIRDIYEAFVIYCFFSLLLSYLGGERSLLILLHGRSPKAPPFPMSIFKRELDVSDPHTFLFLKRGIIQYVQVKPALAAATLILKACGWYNEGDFRANSGYLYVSVVYNISICLALYCLAMFWLCVSDDLKPFRPVPKFLCIKGILFFSFWQSIIISILVAANVITRLGPYTDAEHISLGLTDTLICIEMPFFALAHLYAFNYTDFINPKLHFCARMPIRYAFIDAFSIKDVVEDSKATLWGEGMDYRDFEPAEGVMHQGAGRERRIKAGLRYSKGGKKKYWLPRARADERARGRVGRVVAAGDNDEDEDEDVVVDNDDDDDDDVHARLLLAADETVWDSRNRHQHHHQPHDDNDGGGGGGEGQGGEGGGGNGYELPFRELDPADEALFDHCRQYVFGDYNYPVIDVSDEGARTAMWHEEERVLRDERGAWRSPIRNVQVGIQGKVWEGYGAVGTTTEARSDSDSVSRLGHGEDLGAALGHRAHTPEVRLRWAPPSPSHDTGSRSSLHVPEVQRARTSSTASSSASSGGPSRSLKTKSKSEKTNAKPLPPDAIDLVVEDREAAALKEQAQRERRAGEPSFRKKGLRKVHQQESAGPRQDGGRPSGNKDAGTTGRPERDERTPEGGVSVRIWGPDYSSPTESKHEETIVDREGTPPAHARMMYDELEGSNPWA